MARNYDELISEMLRSIDQNTNTIRQQQSHLVKQNRVLDQRTVELTRQYVRNEVFFRALKDEMKGRAAVQNNQLEMILHTAKLLDRIVKTNKLKT